MIGIASVPDPAVRFNCHRRKYAIVAAIVAAIVWSILQGSARAAK